jgi:glucose/mannose transport system substrate-binding protein
VPANIHRANVLWYNKKVFQSAGVQPPKTVEEFFQVADKLKTAGVTPLALGDNGIWAATHLFETVLVGSLGAEGYRGLWTGKTDWNGPGVRKALETMVRMLGHVNTDHAARSWDQANDLVIQGKAGMTIMGDWAEGFFKSLDLEPETGFGWAPSPGTDGIFQFLSDSFVMPVGAPNPEAAEAWLKVAGSQAGQDAFNPVKGSIPARSDGDRSLYDAYLTSAMDDWSSDTVVGSLTHGVVANDAWKAEIDTAIGLFLADGDAAAFQQALVEACSSEGACS